jgi:polyisoprenoid-binding protein YceI
MLRTIIAAALALLISLPSWGQWTLDPESSALSFISTKAGTVAEVHRFERLSGTLDDGGAFELIIAMDSLNTGIEIRDERMREILFNTGEFAYATVNSTLDSALFKALAPGAVKAIEINANLQLMNQSIEVTVPALIAKMDEGSLLVSALQPVVLDAGSVGLLDGIEQLRQLAGLPSISSAVPVSFVLTFRAAEEPAPEGP